MALLLIPNFGCAVLIVCAIVSIDLGVMGYMVWWGVNLDSISMIGLVMSVGFSIDLSSHVSYAYVAAEGTKKERAITACATLGWPVFQGAFASILGTLVLGTVDAYIIKTFFKTMVLVIVFGLAHGILFMPVALITLLPDKQQVDNCINKVKLFKSAL